MNDARVCLIILDGAGIGPAPDAGDYGDAEANTLGHVWEKAEKLEIPNLLALGLGKLLPRSGAPFSALGAYGKMIEKSAGKDTTTGHWELAGLITQTPFPTFPHGFPPELIRRFEELAGVETLGNKAASGTAIIEELGPQHQSTGRPIIYTSADSVFQIAAHTDVLPLEELYRLCTVARKLLTGAWGVGRVIARPFIGSPGAYVRTDARRDFSLPPHGPTILDAVREAGGEVVGIGKIEDIFAGRGLTRSIHTHDNDDGMRVLLEELRKDFPGLIFANLVDFDMKFGHRRDIAGFARALEAFDRMLPAFYRSMSARDTLIITADHGNDPAHHGTDHTREIVPLLARGRGITTGENLGTRATFADVAATIADLLCLPRPETGEAFSLLQTKAEVNPLKLKTEI